MSKAETLKRLEGLPAEELEALLKLKEKKAKSKGVRSTSRITAHRKVTHFRTCRFCNATTESHYKIQVSIKACDINTLTPLTLTENLLTCEDCSTNLFNLPKELIISNALSIIQSLVPYQRVHKLPREVKSDTANMG